MIKSKTFWSVRSFKSESSNTGSEVQDEISSMLFEELLPFLCRKFYCESDVFVKRVSVLDNNLLCLNKAEIPDYAKRPVALKRLPLSTQPSSENLTPTLDAHNVILVTGFYDIRNRLTEVLLYDIQKIPCLLMQAIAYIAPNYSHLAKMSLRRCRLYGSVIHNLSKVLSLNNLTEICLDDSFLPEHNFSHLLEKPNSLRHLSLARCRINDDVCKTIAKRLYFQMCAEKKLLLLNLSGNCITDVGAKCLAEMLRSNRHLRYLNLASNEVTDEGTFAILNVLLEFPLTYDEIVEKRRRMFSYLRKKKTLVEKYFSESSSCSVSALSCSSQKSSAKQKVRSRGPTGQENDLQPKVSSLARAEFLTGQIVEKFEDPFRQSKVISRDGWFYSTGNMTLSYLNLAYNDLTFSSVKMVLEVLLYHENFNGAESGLQKIVIEGNYLPKSCPEFETISSLINKKLTKERRKSTSSKKIYIADKSKAMSTGQLKLPKNK